MLTREIAQAPGLALWEAGELAETDEERRIWRYIKSGGPAPDRCTWGSENRIDSPPRNGCWPELSPREVNEIDGGHDWRTWCALWDNFLDSRAYESVE